jgi:DNA repair protein SbcD/Mre11
MRILHTSDWHMNAVLGRINRQQDIVARLEQIAGYLEARAVDVMLMSGDFFSHYSHTRIEDISDAIADVHRIFKPFLMRGGTILAISGNHDNEALFNLMRLTLDLAVPLDPRDIGPRPPGRLYLAARPTCLRLKDAAGVEVQFALMPYPTPARYLNGHARFESQDERNRILHQQVMLTLNRIKNEMIDPRLPSVLVAHAHIRGSQLTKHNLYRLSEREDVIFDAGDLPTNWAYMAYGHIHRPQKMGGTEHVRYAGSVERMDKAERDDEKSVVVFDVGKKGRKGDPEELALAATPIYQIEITDPERQVPMLRQQYLQPETALLSYRLVYKPGEHNRESICREIEAIFPRWYQRDIVVDGAALESDATILSDSSRDVPGAVRDYLLARLGNHPDREAVIRLAEQLMSCEEAK